MKVSIILPSLNVALYVEQCILSVLNQTLKDIEIICVDAGSTDGTLEIIKKYIEQDTRIKLIHSEEKSYGKQVNIGIKCATGEYIGIVETDDYIHENMYESLYNCAIVNDCEVVKSDYIQCVQGLPYDIQLQASMFGDDMILYDRIYSKKDYGKLCWKDYSVWRGIYKREFLIKNHIYFNESKGAAFQDIGFQQLVFMNVERIKYISDKSYYYRIGHSGQSTFNKNVLQFVQNELRYLLDNPFLTTDKELLTVMYSKFLSILTTEFAKIIRMEEYNIQSDNIYPYYTFIRKQLMDAYKDNLLKNISNIDEEWSKQFLLLTDIEQFTYRLKLDDNTLKEQKKQFYNAVKHKRIGIFGTGMYGIQAFIDCIADNLNVIEFYDNDISKQNTCLYNRVIKKPSLDINNNVDIVLIANKKHYIEIQNQLQQIGIDKDDMFVYKKA